MTSRDFSGTTASFDIDGWGCGAGFLPRNAFDKCSVAPQDQQWGWRHSSITMIVRPEKSNIGDVQKSIVDHCHLDDKILSGNVCFAHNGRGILDLPITWKESLQMVLYDIDGHPM